MSEDVEEVGKRTTVTDVCVSSAGAISSGEGPVFRRLFPVRSLTDYPEIAAGTRNWETFSGRTRSVGTRRGERAGIYPENGLILPFFLMSADPG